MCVSAYDYYATYMLNMYENGHPVCLSQSIAIPMYILLSRIIQAYQLEGLLGLR